VCAGKRGAVDEIRRLAGLRLRSAEEVASERRRIASARSAGAKLCAQHHGNVEPPPRGDRCRDDDVRETPPRNRIASLAWAEIEDREVEPADAGGESAGERPGVARTRGVAIAYGEVGTAASAQARRTRSVAEGRTRAVMIVVVRGRRFGRSPGVARRHRLEHRRLRPNLVAQGRSGPG